MGARPRDIGLQFLVETATTTLVGGALGLACGGALAVAIAQRLGAGAGLSFAVVALGLGLSLVTGLLAGVAPARRAAPAV